MSLWRLAMFDPELPTPPEPALSPDPRPVGRKDADLRKTAEVARGKREGGIPLTMAEQSALDWYYPTFRITPGGWT